MNNEEGFTLIEMMIVLLVISVLLLIALPNVTKHSSSINKKGCKAYIHMVQGQVQAFELEYRRIPTIEELKSEKYIGSGEAKCPSGNPIYIDLEGIVREQASS